MKVKEKLVSNATYLFLNWFSLNLLSLIYWILAAKILIPGEYGIVSTSFNLASLLGGITLLGLNTAMQKLIPEYSAKNKKSHISQLIKNSLKLIFLANLTAILFLVVLSPFIQQFLKFSFDVIIISLIFTSVITFSSFFSSVVYGSQKMKKYFIGNFLGRLTKVLIAIPLIYLGFSYFGALIGMLAGILISGITFFLTSLAFINFRSSARINFEKIFKAYAMPAFVTFVAWALFSNSQYILLTLIKNPEITGIFTLAMVLTSVITSFPRILNSALFPIISYLSAFKERVKQAHLTNLVIRYSIFLSLPLAFLFIIFSKQVILIVSTEKYLQASSLFPILTLASIIFGIGNIFLSNLYAIGKTKINRNIVLLTSSSFLIFTIPLTFHFSSFGLSIAYLFSTTILFIPSYFYTKKYIPVKLPLKDLLKCLISAMISFSFLYLGVKLTTGIIGYILALIACFLYLLILLPLKFFTLEDVEILEMFSLRIKFIKKLALLIKKLI
jgi:O-antigen/teichoic acid export membrane protein